MDGTIFRASYVLSEDVFDALIKFPECEVIAQSGAPYWSNGPGNGDPDRIMLSTFYRSPDTGHKFTIREILSVGCEMDRGRSGSGYPGADGCVKLEEVHLVTKDLDTFLLIGNGLHSTLCRLDCSLQLEQVDARSLG